MNQPCKVDPVFTVTTRLRHQIDPVKGSRFLTTVGPVASEAEARALLAEVAAELSDASHHCSAWRIASPALDRCSDDGEPSGSAGRPILAQLVGRDLVNVGVIVTRYFGGTKLGVGGLVRAYGGAAGAALDTAPIELYAAVSTVGVVVDYSDAERVQRVCHERGWTVSNVEYGNAVSITVTAPEAEMDELTVAIAEATAGRAAVDLGTN